MNKNTRISIGIIALAVITGGVYASMSSTDDALIAKDTMEQKGEEDSIKLDNMENKAVDDVMIEEKSMMNESGGDTVMNENEAIMVEKGDIVVKAGSYEAYGANKLALAETGDVVLFFHASWCPSCRGLNGDIEKNVGAIPDGVTILKTDYDTESELKKKYGVTTQHTLVQVDKDGNLIKKWSGSPKLENLISQIQ